MRIGIEAQRLFRPKKHGMDIVALELIKALHETDRENEYHIFVKKDADVLCLNITHPNFILHILPSMPYPLWEQVYLPLYIKKFNLDVLHCLGNTTPLICSVPVAVTIHDLIYLESVNMDGTMYQNFGNLYRRFIVPAAAKNAKAIIAISHFEKNNIARQLKVSPERLKVVYNAVGNSFNTNYSQEEYKRVRKDYALPANFILFISNPSPRKNSRRVLEAFIQYRKVKPQGLPIVIMNGDQQLIKDVLKETNGEQFADQVIVPKYVSSRDLPLLYGEATIFLYPSLREGFGLPILEAMACGTPVITSDISAMPEVAGDAALLINPSSVKEISDAILKLDNDPALRSSLVAKGFTRSSEFSWTASAKQSIEIYKSLKI